PYPRGVVPVHRAVTGTAFFPGGYGLWRRSTESQLPEFPVERTMVLGQDFDSEAGYLRTLLRDGPESNATWRNLLPFLHEVGISPETCFFTNLFMGLRK